MFYVGKRLKLKVLGWKAFLTEGFRLGSVLN